MKVLQPGEEFKADHDSIVIKEILENVNLSIAGNRFMYTSDWPRPDKNDTKYFCINAYRFYTKYGNAVFDPIIKLLQDGGYDAYHKNASCAHGPFYAIYLRKDNYNPDVTEYEKIS